MTQLPTEFINMLHDLLGDEASDLIKALDTTPVTSVRLNKRKPGAEFHDSSPVAWCKSGLYLKERPEFILDPLLHAGAYYVQDASSMIYETVIEKLLPKLYEDNGYGGGYLKLLDLCAAPGGKTTAMINALPDGSRITANEYSSKRVNALKENIAKWGYPFVDVTNRDTSYYAGKEEEYDIVAVDAPCSGEGMMRKDETARIQWSYKLIEQCSLLQKEILVNAVKALKPGGFLIYSTCTFNRKENEENADFITSELKLDPVELYLPSEWGIMRGINTDLPVYRFMPHKTQGEGLFLAVFRKKGTWKPSEDLGVPVKKEEKDKIQIKTKKGNKILPNRSSVINRENYKKKVIENEIENPDLPHVEVDINEAISYLRGESLILPQSSPLGLIVITYKGFPLGKAKNIGSRANNLYPKNWRILKR